MDDDFGCFVAGMLVCFAFGIFVVGGPIGCEGGKREIRTEAVQRGHAEWLKGDDGNTTFRWLPTTQPAERQKR